MFFTAVVNSGSSRTRRKLSRPTHRALSTRLVSCRLSTKARTSGHHEKYVNVSSSGSVSTSVLTQPPPAGERRPRPAVHADRQCASQPARPARRTRRVDVGVGLGEQGGDVGVLLGEHGLHDRVEDRVHLLGVRRRLGDQRLVEDVVLERSHLLQRHVDEVGHPGVGLGELLGAEDRQRRRADRGVVGGQRLGVGDGGFLVGQLAHVEEVDPLHRGVALGIGGVGPHGGDRDRRRARRRRRLRAG